MGLRTNEIRPHPKAPMSLASGPNLNLVDEHAPNPSSAAPMIDNQAEYLCEIVRFQRMPQSDENPADDIRPLDRAEDRVVGQL